MITSVRKSIFILGAVVLAITSAGAQKYPIVKLSASGSERFLAEDIGRNLDLVLDTIQRTLVSRQNRSQSRQPSRT